MRSTAVAVASLALAALLSACGGGSSKGAAPTSTTTTSSTSKKNATTTTTSPYPCAPTAEDCTPEQVIATVAMLYEEAGATPKEAACLAPITATGSNAVNQAFGPPTEAQTDAAIKCAGSEERLRAIATALAALFAKDQAG